MWQREMTLRTLYLIVVTIAMRPARSEYDKKSDHVSTVMLKHTS